MFDLRRYHAANYPAVAVTTAEERRLTAQICAETDPEIPVYLIAAGTGLRDARSGRAVDPQATYPGAWAKAEKESAVVIALDWQHLSRSAAGYRPLLDALPAIRQQRSIVVLAAPTWTLPDELRHALPVLDHDLPTREQLESAARLIAGSNGIEINGETPAILDAMAGLTLAAAEDAAALAYLESGTLDPAIISREKVRTVRQQSGLEIAAPADLSQVGGLAALKRWAQEEIAPHRRDPQLRVKAGLLVGPPGTGKSLACRAIGSALGCPVARADLASARGRYVGQTEDTVKAILRTADAISPCVLWLDEIDSALGGHSSSASTDGGVTLGVLSILLTWMQEHTTDVTLLATANRVELIPPALLRPGRVDAIWSVDLPTRQEREEIARIHLNRLKCAPDHAQRIGHGAEDYSGAEIEAVCLTAARRSNRTLSPAIVETAIASVTPLARSRADDLAKMRQWSQTYARPANDRPEDAGESRKIRR